MDLRAQKMNSVADALVKDGIVSPDQLAVAKESQRNMGGDLREILVQRGFVSEGEFVRKMGALFGFGVLSLSTYQPDPDVVRKFSAAQARCFRLIPLFEVEGKLMVATADPFNVTVLDEAQALLGTEINAVLAPVSDIEAALQKYYAGETPSVAHAGVELIDYERETSQQPTSPLAQLELEARAGQVVAQVNHLLEHAYRERASDLHLEPTRQGVNVRFRIDGALELFTTLPSLMHDPVISRIKIMGAMDVAERRATQDGRVRVKIADHEIDLRIATYPTLFGEACAIRLLTKEQLMNLEDLGFLPHAKEAFEALITKPHGIFLVTGPTGSGKSTTLYAALLKADRKNQHVLSVEDPVEHEIEGVSQTQINLKAGISFASSIRAMLRQDPDLIMVGEIRDQETADIAFRAAMTGHLVFSTLHANTAIGSIFRLLDIGVERYLIPSSLLGILAERLVRRICPHCKIATTLSPKQIKILGITMEGAQAFHGTGCQHCRMTGYYGRIGLFELLLVDDTVKELVNQQATETQIQVALAQHGHTTMRDDGLEKMRMGSTTADEVIRVVTQVSA